MSETKKNEYKRNTGVEAVLSLIERVKLINSDEADYIYPNKIRQVYLFGSLVNTDKEKVHDVDIYIVVDDDRTVLYDFASKYARSGRFLDMLSYEQTSKIKFLQNRKKIYSIHTSYIEDLSEFVKKDKYIMLFDDYQPCTDACDKVNALRNK